MGCKLTDVCNDDHTFGSSPNRARSHAIEPFVCAHIQSTPCVCLCVCGMMWLMILGYCALGAQHQHTQHIMYKNEGTHAK